MEKSRSRQGEDKIRGLLGWLSYLDKLYKARKYKVNSKLDRDIPIEHYWKSMLSSFFSGLLIWGYPVIFLGIIFYFRQFRKIEVTDKLFKSVFFGVFLGSAMSIFVLVRFMLSDSFLIWLAEMYLKAKDIKYIGKGFGNVINEIGMFFLNCREWIGTVYIVYVLMFVVMIFSYFTSHKIKEHYGV